MKLFLLLLSLIISLVNHGQDKLKMEVTANGDTLYSTGDKKIYTAPGPRNALGETVKSEVYKSAAGISLSLYIQTGRTSVFTVSRDDAAEITFKDGSMLRLYPNSNSSSRRSSLSYGCWIFVFYRLDRSALEQLRSQDIASITVSASLGKMVYELKDKQADEIRNQVLRFE